jgi:hypothetical protein
LNVAEDADFDADVNIDGDLTVDGVSDVDSLHAAQGVTMAMTLDVDGTTTLDSLNVAEDADFDADVNIDGDLQLDGHANLDSTLTVADFADFNDSLDVAMSVNIQDNLDVNDSLDLNTANNEGRVFTVYDSQGGLGVTIETMNTSGSTAATVLTTHQLIVQDDAVYNGDMNVNGALAVTSNITSAAAPTSPNHITNKQYVDGAIAAAITPPQVFDYDVTNSTSGDTVYYINGDLLLYLTEEDAMINYTITVYGTDLDDVTGAELRARGNSHDLTDADNDWTPAGDGLSATFKVGYTDIKTLAGGQEDGYVSCSMTITNATATYNSGLTIRFFLDKDNPAATDATFQTPAP